MIKKKFEMLNQSIKLACQRSKVLIQDICHNLFLFGIRGFQDILQSDYETHILIQSLI